MRLIATNYLIKFNSTMEFRTCYVLLNTVLEFFLAVFETGIGLFKIKHNLKTSHEAAQNNRSLIKQIRIAIEEFIDIFHPFYMLILF